MKKHRVLLADDHALIRSGLRSILSRSGEYEVVAEASSGAEAVELCRLHLPDLVLMDIYMRDGDGIWATRAIREEFPGTAVIIISVSDDKESMVRAFEAGASAYLLKSSRPEDLFRVMHHVTEACGFFLPLAMSRREESSRREALTGREREILGLVADGATNTEIARSLGISPNTVKNHVKNILGKLGVRNRAEAVSQAIKEGILPGQEDGGPKGLSPG